MNTLGQFKSHKHDCDRYWRGIAGIASRSSDPPSEGEGRERVVGLVRLFPILSFVPLYVDFPFLLSQYHHIMSLLDLSSQLAEEDFNTIPVM